MFSDSLVHEPLSIDVMGTFRATKSGYVIETKTRNVSASEPDDGLDFKIEGLNVKVSGIRLTKTDQTVK